MTKVAVFGAGSWGTAFSFVLADAGNDVTLWARREDLCSTINEKRENTDYLPGIELPDAVSATHDPAEALDGAAGVFFVAPSQTFRQNLGDWVDLIPSDAVLVSLMKGVELGTLKRMSEVIVEVTGGDPGRIGVVSGPNLAKEIARREPAASVVACTDEANVTRLRAMCHSATFRPYSSVDVIGCELGGAYKNVIGLAVGMAVGLGFGDNTTASVITRGLAETARLSGEVRRRPDDPDGAGRPRRPRGHLLLTALTQPQLRGEAGQGMTADEITASTRQVAEGVKSCSSLLDLAHSVEVYAPIVEAVHSVVEGEMTAADMLTALISKQAKHERD